MSLFALNPREEDGLCFAVHTYNSSPVGKLTVTNESATPIAFMIRTTKPGRYCVVPNQKSWPKADAKKSGQRVDLSSTENAVFLLGSCECTVIDIEVNKDELAGKPHHPDVIRLYGHPHPHRCSRRPIDR